MKSIIFNTEMVKAVLDGRRAQFRIPIKLKDNSLVCTGYIFSSTDRKRNSCYSLGKNKECDMEYIKSKYKADDILYAKETFCVGAYANDGGCETNGYSSKTYVSQCSFDNNIIYYTDAVDECDFSDLEKEDLPIWKPSVHLKQKDARIFLKITNVRVERLQDILLEDMLKEGISHIQSYQNGNIVKTSTQIKREFINSWNSKAKDGYKWEDNPYVFVYEFERINKED